MVVAVPRLMESLKDKIERDYEAAGKLEWFKTQFEAAKGEHFVRRWWRFRRIHAGLAGSSGRSSPAARRSMPRPRSSGGG